jgi:tetratricopeptide (TPR) repeat protein
MEDLQSIIKEKEITAAKASLLQAEIMQDYLTTMKMQYQIYTNSIEKLLSRLQSVNEYIQGLLPLKKISTAKTNKSEKHFKSACYYMKYGEIWQGIKECTTWIEDNPKDSNAYKQLVQIYIQAELWRPAIELIKQAQSHFSDVPEFSQMKTEIENKLDETLKKIEILREQGNIIETRKLLNEYTKLRPEDQRALDLEKESRKQDDGDGDTWNEEIQDNSEVQRRFDLAVENIKQQQFEFAIGILEGIYNDFPEMRATMKEQIGDIRVIQKDFPSALWNYSKALTLDPTKTQIAAKIKTLPHH